MAKFVRYTGETDTYYPCDAKKLTKGKVYEVVEERELDWQTNYRLHGVEGEFNNVWFEELPVKIAVGAYIPKVGAQVCCLVLEYANDQITLTSMTTSQVQEVTQLCNNTWQFRTCNSVYILQVKD